MLAEAIADQVIVAVPVAGSWDSCSVSPSWPGTGIGVCTQALAAASQLSAVQVLPSLQVGGVPARQVPPATSHVSAPLQKSPSSQSELETQPHRNDPHQVPQRPVSFVGQAPPLCCPANSCTVQKVFPSAGSTSVAL